MTNNPPCSDIEREWLEAARATLQQESNTIQQLADRMGEPLLSAARLILDHRGKVIVSGMGKSGLVGRKIVATLCGTGTPAVFLHPAEAIHGDIGVYSPGDPSILISKSGSTSELVRLAPLLRQCGSPLIALVGNLQSALARESDVVLDATVEREADPLGLAPTASAMAALAIGDALASALMTARRFSESDFAGLHPGGQLGRNLTLRVEEVMHPLERVACVAPTQNLRAVVIAMTEHPLGAACVLGADRCLLGLITEGDLRRTMTLEGDVLSLPAERVMTESPISIAPHAPLREALHRMEDRPSQISVLPVAEPESGRCLGLIRIHDIYQLNLT